jgi:hypothetical protein
VTEPTPNLKPAELAADMRRRAAASNAVMLTADAVEQWADAIDTLTEDNESLRKATRLHGVSGPLLQAAVSDKPEQCMYCKRPADPFTITCITHGTRPTTSLGDKLRAQMEHTIPGSDAASMLERLAGEADDWAEDMRRREGTWQRLYTSMKAQRNQYRERLKRD